MVFLFIDKHIQEILFIHLYTDLTAHIYSWVYSAVHGYKLDHVYHVSQENNVAPICMLNLVESNTVMVQLVRMWWRQNTDKNIG